jgi:hypothetical protein
MTMMQIEGHGVAWSVHDELELEAVLRRRDRRGGGLFWLFDEALAFPCLAIRVSGEWSAIDYFPSEEHPGLRCLGDSNRQSTGTTTLVYEGCDPYTGDEEPNEFLVPFATTLIVAKHFFRTNAIYSSVQWYSLIHGE